MSGTLTTTTPGHQLAQLTPGDLAQAGKSLIRDRARQLGPATGKGPDDLAIGEAYLEAMAENTRRAYRARWAAFCDWCAVEGFPMAFPAHAITPDALVVYIEALARDGVKVNTIKGHVSAIARFHTQLDIPSPASAKRVQEAVKAVQLQAIADGTSDAVQAVPMRYAPSLWPTIKSLGAGPLDLRDGALLWLAYDTGARGDELRRIRLADLQRTGEKVTATVHSTKTRTTRPVSLRPRTVEAVKAWASAVGMSPRAPLFCPLSPKSVEEGKAITTRDIARIFADRGRPYLPPAVDQDIRQEARDFTAHSVRVGLAQDLRAAGYSSGDIAQAMGWQSDAMPNLYTRHLAAHESAAARLAQDQDRAET